MYNLKLIHGQALAVLCCLCEQISNLHRSEFKEIGVYKAVFNAVKHGIVEFIVEIVRHYPDIIWCEDDLNRGIFLYATLQRQEKIFSLIYKMGAKKNSMATSWDKYHNNILHQAAFLAPSSQLDRVSGAALQMQRELQWYKVILLPIVDDFSSECTPHISQKSLLHCRRWRALSNPSTERW
jgi:hypothetical protein